MSDTVVELEFRIPYAADALGVPETPDAPVHLERTIPVGDGEFLVYGTTDEDAIPTLEEMVASVPSWESVSVVGERIDDVRFQLRLSDPPILSDVADLGGSVEQLVVDDDVRLTVHLPQEVEVREVVEALQTEYESGEAVARRQVAEHDDQSQRLAAVWQDELTDRQRTVVETAYFAGFFEWPRATSGEEVAEALDISGPTFSQHLRAAENKIFARLVGDEPDDSESSD
jgi:predicted DNA binding protein